MSLCCLINEPGNFPAGTIIRDAMSSDLTRALRARIMEACDDQLQKKRRSGLRFAQLGALLYHGRVFEEAAQLPKQMALAEYMAGGGYGIWQYLCSVRGEGTQGLPCHKDGGCHLRPSYRSGEGVGLLETLCNNRFCAPD